MMYSVRCVIELTAPLHCGGGTGDGLLDSPVTRDAFGLWRMAGSSLAGVLRQRVQQTISTEAEEMLFGSGQKNIDMPSRVWCSDMVLLDYDGSFAWEKYAQGGKSQIQTPSFVRDHVCIELDQGAAKKGGKFDMEYVPAGTRFAFEVRLDGWQESLQEKWVQWFGQLMSDVQKGSVQLGGKAGSGYGQYSMVESQGRFFDLRQAEAMTQWLNLLNAPLFEKHMGEHWDFTVFSQEQSICDGLCGYIEIPLKSKGPLLIAGGMGVQADMNFATTAWCNQSKKGYENAYVLPATSLKGVLRHRVYYILQSLGFEETAASKVLQGMFGFVDGGDSASSKVRVSDARLCFDGEKPEEPVVQHVAIDRFTGGAMDAHLFNEAPLWGEDVCMSLVVHVHSLSDIEAALLGHAILDLVQGQLAVGSGGNRGNGRFIKNETAPIRFTLFRQGQKATESMSECLEAWNNDFTSALQQAKEQYTC